MQRKRKAIGDLSKSVQPIGNDKLKFIRGGKVQIDSVTMEDLLIDAAIDDSIGVVMVDDLSG